MGHLGDNLSNKFQCTLIGNLLLFNAISNSNSTIRALNLSPRADAKGQQH